MSSPRSAEELIEAVSSLQAERNELFALLQDVAGSVLDPTPHGLCVAYLSATTLADIRRRVYP
jgi:hypothetical protein